MSNDKIFSKNWFDNLNSQLHKYHLDEDLYSFDEILKRIQNKSYRSSPNEFAICAIYSILVSGFKQEIGKKYHKKIIEKLQENCHLEDLLEIFENANKMYAVWKIWHNRNKYCSEYYNCKTLDEKLNFLKSLKGLGEITNMHLARNLGEDVVKYDIWIQRLGILYSGKHNLTANNAKLFPEIKKVCDNMFNHLVKETGFPRGYIDVVLFKSASSGLISFNKKI